MSPSETTRPDREAIALWDNALAEVSDQETWVAEAVQQLTDARLVHEGVLSVRVARPRILSAEECAKDQAVVSAAGACLVAAGGLVLSDAGLSRRYLGEWLEDSPYADLFRMPSGYPQEISVGRFDGVRSPDGLRVMEFNGGLPGGVLPTDGSASVMRTWSPYERLASRFPVRIPQVGAEVVAGVRSTWAGFGGTGEPAVVFAVPDELRDFLAQSLAYMLDVAAAEGLSVRVADPGALSYAPSSGLTLDGARVDLVVRVFFTTMLQALGSRLDALNAAARAGDVCLITSYRSGLFGHKSLFALVTDPAVDLDVPAEARSLAMAHLPWSRLMEDVSTTDPAGSRVRLLDYVAGARDSLVLKPSDGFGGAGVTLGWEQSPEQWRAAVETAMGSGTWIVQAKIDLTTDEFPELAPGFAPRTYHDDHNPIVADGRIVGYFVRLSESGITNVTSGAGSVVPTFFLE
ncbi:MAG: hypothetical protein R2737_15210 [Candidatus Nanopelagicales bacterium]